MPSDALKASNPMGRPSSDATEHFLAYLAAVSRSCSVAGLLAEFTDAKAQDGASKRYLQDLKNRLATFALDFGSMKVGAILPGQIDDWLRGLGLAGQTRNNFRRVLHAFFKFAVVRGYATENAVAKTTRAKVVRGAPKIFSPAQMQVVLEKAPFDFVPYLAIGGFAGLRSAEIERLDWSEIDLAEKFIHVKAEKSKSAQRRLVAISDNLAAWLAPHVRAAGPVAIPERVRDARGKGLQGRRDCLAVKRFATQLCKLSLSAFKERRRNCHRIGAQLTHNALSALPGISTSRFLLLAAGGRSCRQQTMEM